MTIDARLEHLGLLIADLRPEQKEMQMEILGGIEGGGREAATIHQWRGERSILSREKLARGPETF